MKCNISILCITLKVFLNVCDWFPTRITSTSTCVPHKLHAIAWLSCWIVLYMKVQKNKCSIRFVVIIVTFFDYFFSPVSFFHFIVSRLNIMQSPLEKDFVPNAVKIIKNSGWCQSLLEKQMKLNLTFSPEKQRISNKIVTRKTIYIQQQWCS